MTTSIEITIEILQPTADLQGAVREQLLAAAAEIDRMGLSPHVSADLRDCANDVVSISGSTADQAWNELPWQKRFKFRRHKSAWKQAYAQSMPVFTRRYAL